MDNSEYTYYLNARLPKMATVLYGIIIEYTYQTSLPLVLNDR